jgi:DNA-binding response OmpR family regulator
VRLADVRILLVEDNPHMAEIVRTVLRSFEARMLDTADTLEGGWASYVKGGHDLVILDRNLGREDGLDLVRRIRRGADSPTPFMPILMLTGSAELPTVAAARDAGVNEFLVKPFTVTALYERLAAIVHRPRPFISTETYLGPDRRRRADPDYAGAERRAGAGVADA